MKQLDTKRQSFLCDVLVTAVEGGVGGWCTLKNYTEASVEVHEDGTRGGWVLFTPAVIQAGINLIKSGKVELNRTTKAANLHGDAENDADQTDTGNVDCIFQAVLFGEIRYA